MIFTNDPLVSWFHVYLQKKKKKLQKLTGATQLESMLNDQQYQVYTSRHLVVSADWIVVQVLLAAQFQVPL